MILGAVCALAALAAAGVVVAAAAQGGSAPGRSLLIACPAPALGGTLPAEVYLPAGYAAKGRRYPVVYFLHGLPASPQSFTQNAFIAAALVRAHQRAIVVAPQGARTSDSDREYLDWSASEDWPLAISDQLTACVDSRFHTVAGRSGRALIGLSAGGYGAFNIGLRNLRNFGAVESWSGYFVATDPSGDQVLKLGSAGEQRAAAVLQGAALAKQLGRWPSLVAFYVGHADDRFADMNTAFDASLRASHIAHVFRSYPGGHSYSLWQSQAPAWLTMALTYLSTGHTVPVRGNG